MAEIKNEALQGGRHVKFARLYDKAAKEPATMIPDQTSSTFGLARTATTTQTKSGINVTLGNTTSTNEVGMLNVPAGINDDLYTGLLHGKKIEVWDIALDRVNSKGQCFAWYSIGYVTNLSESDAPNANSTLTGTFTITGSPVRGWVTLSDDQKAEIEYVYDFKGLDKRVTDSDDGNGLAFDEDKDAGVGTDAIANTPSDKAGAGK